MVTGVVDEVSSTVVPEVAAPEFVAHDVLRLRTMIWAAVVIIGVGLGAAAWLLSTFGGGSETQRNGLEAVKTAASVMIAAGGGVALLLAARRQRSAEIALNQKESEQRQAARVAASIEADASERRITDLYTKAVDQLGADQAAVRLGGLYALERLAQDNVAHRPTIVEMLCAYLRMPYDVEQTLNAPTRGRYVLFADRLLRLPVVDCDAIAPTLGPMQEQQVRLAAQRILAKHLRPDPDPSGRARNRLFWPDMDLDLSGAPLIDFDLSRCRVRSAIFDKARFAGASLFAECTFTGNAWFAGAQFCNPVGFRGTRFAGEAWFGWTVFVADSGFVDATFGGNAGFREARFDGNVWFDRATFGDLAQFTGARFAKGASFDQTRFDGGEPPEVAGHPLESVRPRGRAEQRHRG